VDRDGGFAVKVVDGEFMWEGISLENEDRDDEKNEPVEEEPANTSSTASLITEKLAGSTERIHMPKSQLQSINLLIPRGKLVAIVGSVGSGKSSLLSALVGEMKRVHGEVIFGGSVGYCPQNAWIQNATLRMNVTFGLPFHEERYSQVIRDCCLEPDLAILPAGDMTEIGEKGINLSGGQKQRVNIARAVYFDADIVLLDDPLSASYLFTNCIQGALSKKTRLLVTHHLQVLTRVDYIIFMDNGKISEQGTYEQLMKDNKKFSELINEFGEVEESEGSEIMLDLDSKRVENDFKLTGFLPAKELMQKEERVTGAVENSVYLTYIRAAGGIILIPIILFLLIMMQGSNIGSMIIYCAWGISEGLFSILVALSFSFAGLVAAKNLHNKAIKRVLRAPVGFFDTTPLGLDSILRSSLYAHFSETLTGLSTIRAYREQKRFTDINEYFMDLENRAYYLTISIQRWLGVRLEIIANILIYCAGLLSVIERFQILPSIIGLILSYATQVNVDFNYCVRQTAEVEANMNAIERLVYYSDNLDVEAEPIIAQKRPPPEWPYKGDIEIRDLTMKYGPELPPVIKGISIHIKAAEKIGCGKSTLATSFFRFIEPTSGQIILDGIDITTIGLKDLRSKITIIPQDPVLFNGTLRTNLDPFNEHDDLTLWNALRRAHLINGNREIKERLESCNEKSELSQPQEKKLSEVLVESNGGGEFCLDSPVREHGSNFSQGQQQLIALSRALVRNSKLIIMDEATASVDFKTDSLIQKTIREEFMESTIPEE
ncbi:12093_t:CDS:10, partial [Acaulospora colombiana]